MKFIIKQLENLQFRLESTGQLDSKIIINSNRFYKSSSEDNDPLQYKNWLLPYKYTNLGDYNLPIQVKYISGEYRKREPGEQYPQFDLDENGEHILIIYDWIKDTNICPYEIIKLLKYPEYSHIARGENDAYGTLYVVIQKQKNVS